MKLLQKTNRAYLTLSASAFLIAGAAIYIALNFILEAQISEKINNNKISITKRIKESGIVSNDPPYVVVKELTGIINKSDISIDTIILDPNESEEIPVRQYTSNESINGKYYQIILRNTLVEKSDILVTIFVVIGAVFILLLISIYLINIKLSLILWKPFYNTLDDLKEFSQEESGFSLPAGTDIEEFDELNSGLNKLTEKVISDYHALKRFSEDASHEIQTPLTIIHSKLESLLQEPDLKKDQADLIEAAFSASSRLSRMTKALLLLAKIENRQFTDAEEVNLSEIVAMQIESLSDFISEKSLRITLHLEPGIKLITNSFLAESLVLNLLGNAVKHNLPGGIIFIELNEHSLKISNSGAPLTIPPEKLFERFHKVNKSSDSPGLGLSIVDKICKVSNWQINYTNDGEMHNISVRF
jgi:two-component system, OmpR family, sensor kinase